VLYAAVTGHTVVWHPDRSPLAVRNADHHDAYSRVGLSHRQRWRLAHQDRRGDIAWLVPANAGRPAAIRARAAWYSPRH
jgi:hypothetical protein